MKENKNNKPGNQQHDKETDASIKNGRKAIEVQEKTAATELGKQAEEAKKDAENWRNEG